MNRPCVLSFLLLSSNLDFLTAQIPGDQVRQEWVVRYAALASAIAVDPVGNVYVPGSPTIKLDSQGNTVWIARYTAAFTDIAVDARGNVYVTGWDSNSKGYATIKYDPQGNLVWIARSTNTSRAIALDVAGNVYVAGAMWSENRLDYATTKYDPQGNEMWVARYHGPLVYGSEEATAIAVDAKGNVYVTGGSHPASNAAAYATVKYDPDGNEIWVGRYNADRASAIALDPVGNVYVAGESTSLQDRFGTFHDFFMIKYDPDGTLVWLATYDSGLFNDDRAKGIAVDVTGNVYVTGTSRRDYITLKLDRNGNRVWVARYDGGWADEANDIAVDPAGNVYVTGWSNKGDTDETADYVTIKYDPAGEQVWLARYDGPGKGHDEAAALALDSAGNVYVTGMSRNESLDSYRPDCDQE